MSKTEKDYIEQIRAALPDGMAIESFLSNLGQAVARISFEYAADHVESEMPFVVDGRDLLLTCQQAILNNFTGVSSRYEEIAKIFAYETTDAASNADLIEVEPRFDVGWPGYWHKNGYEKDGEEIVYTYYGSYTEVDEGGYVEYEDLSDGLYRVAVHYLFADRVDSKGAPEWEVRDEHHDVLLRGGTVYGVTPVEREALLMGATLVIDGAERHLVEPRFDLDTSDGITDFDQYLKDVVAKQRSAMDDWGLLQAMFYGDLFADRLDSRGALWSVDGDEMLVSGAHYEDASRLFERVWDRQDWS